MDADLIAEKNKVADLLPSDLKQYVVEENEVVRIEYPLLNALEKINSTNLDKSPNYSGVLKGIKGQYLIFENGDVMNLRSHSGYYVKMTFE